MSTMNPDWSKAPEWANYIAMDNNYQWYWHENEPEIKWDFWNNPCGKAQIVGEHIYWKNSLQKRPDKQKEEIAILKARIEELEKELLAIHLDTAGESQ